ncbi:MAG TPA: zinc ribbon domain-containing protein [Ktedonobacteraceae bacterium]|jgi:hypothetical protein
MSTQMAHCPNCDAVLMQNALFCAQCGTTLSTERLKQELITKSIPDVLKYYDTIAQFLEGIAAALFTFYGGAIFVGKVAAGVPFNAFIYILPLFLLLLTIGTAISVLYPGGYLKHTFEELVVIKDKRLSYLWIISGITGIVFAIAVFVYLTRAGA